MQHIILENGDYANGAFVPAGAIIIDSAPPTSAHSYDAGKWVFNGFSEEQVFLSLRSKRDKLLKETDWQASSDLTMTAEQTAYRQSLRDLPSTATPALDENGQLTGVTWPVKPS